MRYPLFWVAVEGESMAPDLISGQEYLASGLLTPRRGDAVVARTQDGVVVKWLQEGKEGEYMLFGNHKESSSYMVEKKDLLGILVRYRLVKRVLST